MIHQIDSRSDSSPLAHASLSRDPHYKLTKRKLVKNKESLWIDGQRLSFDACKDVASFKKSKVLLSKNFIRITSAKDNLTFPSKTQHHMWPC